MSIKEGWCKKQGGVVKNWKKRYFVLTAHELSYYEKEPPSKQLGVIDLSKASKVQYESDQKHGYVFIVSIPKRTYYIATETAQERDSWVTTLNQVISGKPANSPEQPTRSNTSTPSPAPAAKTDTNPFSSHPHLSFNDFDVISVIGQGTFGKMRLVRLKGNPTLFALKSMRTRDLVENGTLDFIQNECQALTRIKSDFITKAYVTFTDDKHIYIVMDFLPGGELFKRIETEGPFDVERIRLYSAQIALGINDLHEKKIIHRDLKPENVLFDQNGNLQLADLGYSKATKPSGTTSTFCGTPMYMAPEMLFEGGYSFEVDWWALGIILFEMATGYPPFYDENTEKMYQAIVYTNPEVPSEVDPDCADLIFRLLEKEPKRRLANFQSFKQHRFFKSYNEEKWNQIRNKQIKMPWKPDVNMERVLNNFDDAYTGQEASNTIAEAYDLHIDGFSMVRSDD